MDRTADGQAALLRAEMALGHAFRALRDAGDALMDAGCDQGGRAVHEITAHAAVWRQHVERIRKGDIDGE